MGVRRVEELAAYQRAVERRQEIIALTSRSRVAADDCFTSQILDASRSIASNLAEGFGRYLRGEFRQFVRYARGSACEVQSLLREACDRGFLTGTEADRLHTLAARATGTITLLLKSLR